jgi:uncharacterized peroxidase-related enzyme
MNKQRIPSLDPANAIGPNKKHFDLLQNALGMVPNMARAMAQSPAVLEGYIVLSGALSKGTLGRKLGEEIALAMAGTNHCDYCASAHSALAKLTGLSEVQVTDAIHGKGVDPKESAAIQFATTIMEKRGRISDADFQSVIEAGYTPAQAAEIVAQVALNVFTNYFNNVAGTDIDFPKVTLS